MSTAAIQINLIAGRFVVTDARGAHCVFDTRADAITWAWAIRRRDYIRDAVRHARKFNHAAIRNFIAGQPHLAVFALRHRDRWMNAARRAKANDPRRTMTAFWGER